MQFTDGNVIGADVSLYQDNNATPQKIDFSKMVSQGADFVIVRAGQNVWVDEDFAYNWAVAKQAGLPRGSYWFYDDRISPTQQAETFANLTKNDPEELDLWVDLEKTYNGAFPGWQNWKKFLIRLKELRPNSSIGIYTGYYYISGKIPLSEYAFFSQFPLWLAWYTTNPDVVKIPAPWTKCLYWQWGTPSWGIAWGCESTEIDMNKFNGTLDDFKNRYKLGGGTPPPGGSVIYKGTVIATNGLNVRNAPNATATKLFAVPQGTKYEADRVENGWWHLTKINNAAVSGENWSYEGSTKGYIRTDEIINEPPPPTSELPSYFVGYDKDGKALARYNRE
jgi:lysozyme